MRKLKIKDRIRAAYEHSIGYETLMRKVFPYEGYPRAWRYPTRGGPPGCSMAFSHALTQLGASITYGDDGRRVWGLRRVG